MMRLRRLAGPAALLMLSGLSAAGIALQLFFHREAVPAVDTAAILPQVVQTPVNGGPSQDQLVANALAAPMFHRDRRMHVRQPEAVEVSLPPPPPLVLAGYMALPDKPAVIVLKDTSSGRSMRAKIGQSVGDWTVARADPKSVTLVRTGFEAVIGRTGTVATVHASDSTTASVASRGAVETPSATPRLRPPSASRLLKPAKN